MVDYYIDYTNGLDTNTGLKYTDYVVESTADTTHFVDASLHGICTIGCYIWVTGRSGSLVTAFDDDTHTVTLGTAISGLAADDVYYMLAPYKTTDKYIASTRVAGDNGYVRQNMIHTQPSGADTTCLNGGSALGYISLIGCNATQGIDPWHTGSDVRATLDWNAAAYSFVCGQNWWRFYNLKFYNSGDTSYNISLLGQAAGLQRFYNCHFLGGAVSQNTISAAGGSIEFDTCDFDGGGSGKSVVSCSNGVRIRAINCTFDSVVAGCTYGIANSQGCTLYAKDCVFGGTNTFASGDISCHQSWVYLDCCKLYSTGATYGQVYVGYVDSAAYSENHDQVFGAHKTFTSKGTIEKVTDVLHSGGASSSAKVTTTNTYLGPNYQPLCLNERFPPGDFKVWCPASATTVSIWIRSLGTWNSDYPDATELWVEALYVSNATTGQKSSVVSDEVLTDGTTWVEFQVTFTPAVASFAYLSVNLAKYYSGCGIYVDVLPVVS
jgi:hypothetical protein